MKIRKNRKVVHSVFFFLHKRFVYSPHCLLRFCLPNNQQKRMFFVINIAKFKSKIKLVGAGHSSVKNPSPCFLDQLHGAKKIFFIFIDSTPIVFIPSFVAKYPRSWNMSLFNYCISAADYSNKGRRMKGRKWQQQRWGQKKSKNVPGFMPWLEQQKQALTFLMPARDPTPSKMFLYLFFKIFFSTKDLAMSSWQNKKI